MKSDLDLDREFIRTPLPYRILISCLVAILIMVCGLIGYIFVHFV